MDGAKEIKLQSSFNKSEYDMTTCSLVKTPAAFIFGGIWSSKNELADRKSPASDAAPTANRGPPSWREILADLHSLTETVVEHVGSRLSPFESPKLR
jgi:hypothetical protein